MVETEGTNECLADLQDRCGPGAFPPRAMAVSDMTNPRDKDSKLVFRILRERRLIFVSSKSVCSNLFLVVLVRFGSGL